VRSGLLSRSEIRGVVQALVSTYRRNRRTLATVLAVPSVPVVENHVHARRVLRQIIHAKELHHGCALTASASWIELADAQKLRWLASLSGLPNCGVDHGWKPVEVWHANSLLRKRKRMTNAKRRE
jgi:hypothetical protein